MKILVMTQNKILGQGIALELLEKGYSAEYASRYCSGYDLYISDMDAPAENLGKAENILTFSKKEGVAAMKRPFTEEELVEKIKEKLCSVPSDEATEKKEVSEYDTSVLSETEKKLLEVLLENRGNAVSAQELSLRVWGRECIRSNIVNVYIRYLREKLEKDSARRVIFTIRGKGYRID